MTQVKLQFHKPGAVIKVKSAFEKTIHEEFTHYKNKDNTSLQFPISHVNCPNINESGSKFIPTSNEIYFVVASGSKYGFGDELNNVLHRFSHQLEDTLFFIEDEYDCYIKRYEIKNGKFHYETVVKENGDLADYFTEAFPDDKQLHFNLLRYYALEWQGIISSINFQEPIKAANRALKLADDWLLHYLKGTAYEAGRNSEKALSQFKRALNVKRKENPKLNDSDCRIIYHAISVCLNKINQFEQAISIAEKAMAIIPSWGDYTPTESKGYALMQLKRYEEAIECFDEILKHSLKRRDIAYALYNKACVFTFLKQYDEAVALLYASFHMEKELVNEARHDEALFPLINELQDKNILTTYLR
ncbi:tetratricopeptide repeat protein [Aphanothece sacrum]|uniref:tetratricopeptide repeat protein n=1 Tax=Aphanothece sacrum TaxID=1122 RepID=UPI00157FB697|nr:tetratricopeptide repeat protein [Aphanothece sacrum]